MTTDVIAAEPAAPARSRRTVLIFVLLVAVAAVAMLLLIQTGVIFGADPMAGT